jgi:beta-lactamase class A
MVSKKAIILSNALAVIIGGAVSYFVYNSKINPIKSQAAGDTRQAAVAGNSDCSINMERLNSYSLIKPLLYAERECESEHFSPLKGAIQTLIEDKISKGEVGEASVYFRSLSTAEYIQCGASSTFQPGSLAKVPLMLAILYAAETDHQLLDKKVVCNKLPDRTVPVQTFNSQSIQVGHSYTVRELLKYMITYSDNTATYLLHSCIAPEKYHQVFTDLKIPAPSMGDPNYAMSAKDYSKFLIVLYNASYLSYPMSELACSLMNNSEFKEGIAKAIPSNVKIVHKFGEFGNKVTGLHEFHESAIIYLNETPYLITVMTKGNYSHNLPQVINSISSVVYDYMRKGA